MANVTPSTHFLKIVSDLIARSQSIRIAEIGIDRGATTNEVIRMLRTDDTYYLFDLSDCYAFKNSTLLQHNCKINIFTNTRRIYDSYAWNISKILLENIKNGLSTQIWDAVYLDGAHTFHVDAPTTCCLKEMIKTGGFLVFDDMTWCLFNSPTCNTPSMREYYSEEQFMTSHVEMIVNLFMRTDSRFYEKTLPHELRSIFVRT